MILSSILRLCFNNSYTSDKKEKHKLTNNKQCKMLRASIICLSRTKHVGLFYGLFIIRTNISGIKDRRVVTFYRISLKFVFSYHIFLNQGRL